MTEKPFQMRVRTTDNKPHPKSAQQIKGQHGFSHIDMYDVRENIEFVICALKADHLEKFRGKLSAMSLCEIPGGSTDMPAPTAGSTQHLQPSASKPQRGSTTPAPAPLLSAKPLADKPYGFVSVPETFTTVPAIWHDGSNEDIELISGEIRFELTCLTPLLVGWNQRKISEIDSSTLPLELRNLKELPPNKSVLCPLRAPWGKRPVLIPGDTLKGLLRHELGALLGAPMERVAERSYSYRPNLSFPSDEPSRRLEPRLARVLEHGSISLDDEQYPIPTKLAIYPLMSRSDQQYDPPPPRNTLVYNGGMGGGIPVPFDPPLKTRIRKSLRISLKKSKLDHPAYVMPQTLDDGYRRSLSHLFDRKNGHFSSRHPLVTDRTDRCIQAVKAAAQKAYKKDDVIWIEWDTEKQCVVSFGWHYYYRWAFQTTIRKLHSYGKNDKERPMLCPLPEEQVDQPTKLSRIRRIFGYTNDDAGCAGIGKEDDAQLMGHISINAAIEVVPEGDEEEQRFCQPKWTFLKELGMPRPSAVEYYLKQPHYPDARPSDRAQLNTYGDAEGYDTPGQLAGRKFYLDRQSPERQNWEDSSPDNKKNERSTLAVEVSKPGRIFRFTLRFRDMQPGDIAATLLALCPNQFAAVMSDSNVREYCSKLGYARPLGWGSVNIVAKQLFLLQNEGHSPKLAKHAEDEAEFRQWFGRYQNRIAPADLSAWFAVHQRHHPNSQNYPGLEYHSALRIQHTKNRRYTLEGANK